MGSAPAAESAPYSPGRRRTPLRMPKSNSLGSRAVAPRSVASPAPAAAKALSSCARSWATSKISASSSSSSVAPVQVHEQGDVPRADLSIDALDQHVEGLEDLGGRS